MFDINWPYAYQGGKCYECTYHGFDYSFDEDGRFINNCLLCPESNFPDNSRKSDEAKDSRWDRM